MLPVVVAFAPLLIVVASGASVKSLVAPVKSSVAVSPPRHIFPPKHSLHETTTTLSSDRSTLIKAALEKVVGSQKLTSNSTPYYKAFQWIVNTDPLQLGPSDDNLVQRYLAVLLYCWTTQFGPWLSCNPPLQGQNESCFWANLVSVFPKKYEQIPWIRWLTSHHECEWAGVFCNKHNQIITLWLGK